MKILSTDSVNEQKIKAILYAPSGAGKTYSVRSLKKYKPIIASIESGLMSIAGSGIAYTDLTKDDNGNLIPKEDRLARVSQFYSFLLKPETQAQYDTVFIDSITEIGQCMIDRLNKEFPDRKDGLVMWGEYNKKMRDMIKSFRDLPHYHVVFTCLSVIEKDDNGKRYPEFDLSGSISKKLPGFFDLVTYLRVVKDEKGNDKRQFITNTSDVVLAKDRSGKLNQFEEADWGMIFDKILTKTEEKQND